MKPEEQSFACGACGATFYIKANLAAHTCQRVAPRSGIHAADTVIDTGPSWVGKPIPGNRWRTE